ncbi:MAG: hypothetical protein GY757_08415, partial [bacterium]|nr:hypothetical protein [bacterium]
IDVSGVDVSFNVEVSDDLEEITLILPEGSLPHGNLGVNIDTTLEDKAGNKLATQFNVQYGYQGGDAVLYNVSGPEVVRIVYKKTNEFRIKLNKKVAPGSIENSVEIKKTDGSITGTITMVDDRTLNVDIPETLILGHEYQIWVKALLTDDSGMAANEFFHRFVVMDDDMLIYEKDPNKHAHSKIGNNHLFHGRTFEPEVGLYYYRYRYYFPRIGRFLQNDPLGYQDSMNMYQGFNQNPVNYVDPMGLAIIPNSGIGYSVNS